MNNLFVATEVINCKKEPRDGASERKPATELSNRGVKVQDNTKQIEEIMAKRTAKNSVLTDNDVVYQKRKA